MRPSPNKSPVRKQNTNHSHAVSPILAHSRRPSTPRLRPRPIRRRQTGGRRNPNRCPPVAGRWQRSRGGRRSSRAAWARAGSGAAEADEARAWRGGARHAAERARGGRERRQRSCGGRRVHAEAHAAGGAAETRAGGDMRAAARVHRPAWPVPDRGEARPGVGKRLNVFLGTYVMLVVRVCPT